MNIFLVQASSVSWTGIPDLCTNKIDGKMAVYWTIKKIFSSFENASVTLIAPLFDQGGELEILKSEFDTLDFSIRYSHDNSPLRRMIEATNGLNPDQYIIRVDGLHFWFDIDLTSKMLKRAQIENLDCVKPPDDFPAQLSSEIFKVEALRIAEGLLSQEALDYASRFFIHPKFYIQYEKRKFRSEIFKEIPNYSDEFLTRCREQARSIYTQPRIDITEKSVPAGDSISFHYQFSKKYTKQSDTVLDIASGVGFGAALIADSVKEIVCADLDQGALSEGRKRFAEIKNMKHLRTDVTAIDFPEDTFDLVLSFETVEHVDEIRFFEEIHRVLKPGGIAIISTPQNSFGRIPITAEHIREFSLEELINLASRFFEIEDLIGIKAGTICFSGDPKGSNTIAVCRKPLHH